MIDMKDMSGKILWTKGREAGVEAERERISKMAQARICLTFKGLASVNIRSATEWLSLSRRLRWHKMTDEGNKMTYIITHNYGK